MEEAVGGPRGERTSSSDKGETTLHVQELFGAARVHKRCTDGGGGDHHEDTGTDARRADGV